MGFGTPPTVLEGDYSDYSIYDSFDDVDADVYWEENGAFFNLDETVILFIDSDNAVKKYDIATKSLGSSLFTPSSYTGEGLLGYLNRSAYGTYVVWIDLNQDNVRIMKNGVVIKTMSYTDLGLDDGWVRGVSISPKGKYIAVHGKRTASGNQGWVVLVGS